MAKHPAGFGGKKVSSVRTILTVLWGVANRNRKIL